MSLREILSRLEPEAIPFPFSRLYSLISSSRMFMDFYEYAASRVLERLPAGRVLDIGCGPGRLPILIASRNRYLHVTGVDASPDMVKVARDLAAKKGLANVEFKAGRADELPFGDGEFDLVISTLSFHHWKRPEAALDEIHRVLRQGGEAWIYDIPKKASPDAWSRMKDRYGALSLILMRIYTLTEPFYDEERLAEFSMESRFKRFEIGHTLFAFWLRLYK